MLYFKIKNKKPQLFYLKKLHLVRLGEKDLTKVGTFCKMYTSIIVYNIKCRAIIYVNIAHVSILQKNYTEWMEFGWGEKICKWRIKAIA